MPTRLPSLNALRTFESVARHLSISRAARELHVTPAAVSHHLRALEADLGVALLHRQKGNLALTDAAQAALPILREAFDLISEAANRLRAEQSRHILNIAVCSTFASIWLIPRLAAFSDSFHDIDVRLDTTDQPVDFQRDTVDMAIRLGRGDQLDLQAFRLFEENVFPVCSPRLLERGMPLKDPADIRRHTLLHVEWTPLNEELGETLTWESWFREAGVRGVDTNRGLRFSRIHLALQAAIQGLGIALGSDSLAGSALAAGRLVRPFKLALPLGCAYYLVHSNDALHVPQVAIFRNWILAEAGIAPPQAA